MLTILFKKVIRVIGNWLKVKENFKEYKHCRYMGQMLALRLNRQEKSITGAPASHLDFRGCFDVSPDGTDYWRYVSGTCWKSITLGKATHRKVLCLKTHS